MQSNGGVARAAEAKRLPVRSSPRGPRRASSARPESARPPDAGVLSFDMGGTTADVGLVVDGHPQMRFRGHAAGHPVNLPQSDVVSVGAGGGRSIARVDRFGSLSVGGERRRGSRAVAATDGAAKTRR